MFKSVLSSEISDFLDMRLHTVAKTTYEYDVFILTTFDKHLIKKNYRKKILDENVVNSLIQSFAGNSKTVMNKVAIIRNFVKYLNTSGNQSFIPRSPKVKSEYIPYVYSKKELEQIFYYADNLPIRSYSSCNPYLPVMIPMILRFCMAAEQGLKKLCHYKEKILILLQIPFSQKCKVFKRKAYSNTRNIECYLKKILQIS